MASTPMPFGEALPTPDIVSRDLTKPIQDGGGRRVSLGGVTSGGLVDATQYSQNRSNSVDEELSALQAQVDSILDRHS